MPIQPSPPPRFTTAAPPARARVAIAAEVTVPSLGTTFAALARSVRRDGVFLPTFQVLDAGTRVVLELALPDGPLVVEGLVAASDADGDAGIAVDLIDVDDVEAARLDALPDAADAISEVA